MRNFLPALIAIVLGSSIALAQNTPLVERVIEVETKEKNPAAARSILLNMAAEKASEDLIKEIIGEAKFSRNRSLIQTKIMKKSASYLPFSKAGELRQAGDTLQMAVTVRASVDDLQKLLLENGLFYDADSTPSILPMVKWVDRVRGRSFGWWMGPQVSDPAKAFLAKESRSLESALHDAFLTKGFFVLRAQALRYEDMLGNESRGESVRPDDSSLWAQTWNAQVLIQGQVQFAKGERSDAVAIEARLSAVQVSNGRVIGEVARQLETDSGGAFEANVDRKLKDVLAPMAADLSTQLLEAWKQGTINSQLYRLKVAARLSIPVQEQLKEVLRGKVREIKSVKERLIEADAVTYELDSSIGPAEIAKRMGELDVQGVKLIVSEANEKDLVLKVKR